MGKIDPQPERILAGFAAPVPDAQQAFRGLMHALSYPGRIATLPESRETPDGWPTSLASAALTLLDADAPVWLDEAAATADAKAFVRFHTGAPIVADMAAARFVIALTPDRVDFDGLAIGTNQYPDRSTTVLLGLPALDGGVETVLRGPGIQTTTVIAPAGSLEAFWRAWTRNQLLYPLGFDAFLFAGASALGLPRSVAATASEG